MTNDEHLTCQCLKQQFQDLKRLTELLEHLKFHCLTFLINTRAPDSQVDILQLGKGS